MKTLLVLRHAEALPPQPGIDDHGRALAPKGLAQARALGAWLAQRDLAPGRVLCSSALRAQQTATVLIEQAAWQAPLEIVPELYNASAADMLGLVARQPDDFDRLLLVCHAPGVPDLAALLATRGDDLRLVCEPCTLLAIALDQPRWSQLTPQGGALGLLLAP